MEKMTTQEVVDFLLSAPRTAKLATVRDNGRPHVTPVWFDIEVGQTSFTLYFTTWHTTVKAANLRRDSHVALCVDDERPPFAFVVVEGKTEIIEDLDEISEWARRIAERYMGSESAESYGQRNGVPGELLVKVTPEKIIGERRISD